MTALWATRSCSSGSIGLTNWWRGCRGETGRLQLSKRIEQEKAGTPGRRSSPTPIPLERRWSGWSAAFCIRVHPQQVQDFAPLRHVKWLSLRQKTVLCGALVIRGADNPRHKSKCPLSLTLSVALNLFILDLLLVIRIMPGVVTLRQPPIGIRVGDAALGGTLL